MPESTWPASILRRRVTFVKLGRAVRIPESALEAMVAKGGVHAHNVLPASDWVGTKKKNEGQEFKQTHRE